MSPSRHRSAKARLLLLGFGFLASLLLVELLLRVVGFSFPSFYQADSLTGVRAIPNRRGWHTYEGRGFVQFNDRGWRDENHPLQKPVGETRLAVLGDSFTEAKHVNVENAFTNILEQTLRNTAMAHVEVLNFGVAGFGTAQQFLVLQRHVVEYQPDMVLLAFYSGNDVSDNSRALSKNDYVPYFVYEDGALRLDDRFVSSLAFRRRSSVPVRIFTSATRYSRVLQLVDSSRYRWRVSRRLKADRENAQESGLSDFIYSEPREAVHREAWAVTEGLLLKMKEYCDQRQIAFRIATVSNPVQVHPDATKRAEAMTRLQVDDLFYPDRRIAAWGAKHGVKVLNLAAPMLERAESEQVDFHGFGSSLGTGHWNERGHRLAGELIADWLLERGQI